MKRMPIDLGVIILDNDVSEKALKQSYWQKKSLYGIDREQFLEIVERQGHACAACGEDATGVEHTLNVDHDHNTNEIRGLVCSGCNSAAHWLDDDPEKAMRLALYLKNNGTGFFIPETGFKE